MYSKEQIRPLVTNRERVPVSPEASTSLSSKSKWRCMVYYRVSKCLYCLSAAGELWSIHCMVKVNVDQDFRKICLNRLMNLREGFPWFVRWTRIQFFLRFLHFKNYKWKLQKKIIAFKMVRKAFLHIFYYASIIIFIWSFHCKRNLYLFNFENYKLIHFFFYRKSNLFTKLKNINRQTFCVYRILLRYDQFFKQIC